VPLHDRPGKACTVDARPRHPDPSAGRLPGCHRRARVSPQGHEAGCL